MMMTEAEWEEKLALAPEGQDIFTRIWILMHLYWAAQDGSFPNDPEGTEHLERLKVACEAAGTSFDTVQYVAQVYARR